MDLEAGQHRICFRKQNSLCAQRIRSIQHAGSHDFSSRDDNPFIVARHVLTYAENDALRPFFNFAAHA
jgi:hypothetical protein